MKRIFVILLSIVILAICQKYIEAIDSGIGKSINAQNNMAKATYFAKIL